MYQRIYGKITRQSHNSLKEFPWKFRQEKSPDLISFCRNPPRNSGEPGGIGQTISTILVEIIENTLRKFIVNAVENFISQSLKKIKSFVEWFMNKCLEKFSTKFLKIFLEDFFRYFSEPLQDFMELLQDIFYEK